MKMKIGENKDTIGERGETTYDIRVVVCLNDFIEVTFFFLIFRRCFCGGNWCVTGSRGKKTRRTLMLKNFYKRCDVVFTWKFRHLI